MTMSISFVAKTLKRVQKSNKLTCKQMAKLAGVSESAIVRYELGDRNIPEDVIVNIANNGGFDELKIAYMAEKKLGIINTPLMNNIDDNLQCMILRLVREEISEAVEAMWNISNLIMNKKELSKDEMENLYKYMEQVADLIPGIEAFFIRLKQVFGINLDKLDTILCEKLKQKKYFIDFK